MRAVILAAGRGSRLGTRTDNRPKCLNELAGRPLLEWQISALRQAGIDEIGVVCGYKAEKLVDSRYTSFVNERWADTNMVVSLASAENWLQAEPCIVSYSDIVYHPDSVRNLLLKSNGMAITYDSLWIDLWKERFEDPLSDAETFQADDQGMLVTIGDKANSITEIHGQYMGLLKFTPNAWQAIRGILDNMEEAIRDHLDMTSLLQHLLSVGYPIETIEIHGRWCEVDHGSDIDLYERKIMSKTGWSHDWRFDTNN